MAERKENSVLFSLNELRSIEEERQQEVVDSKRKAEEDRIRTQMDNERRAREEAEAQRRSVEDAERNARESAERSVRDDRFRLEEAERRARVEAQTHLEQQRMVQEMQIRTMEAQKKRPTGLIAVSGLLVVAVIGLGIFLYQRSQEAEKKAQELAIYQGEVESQTRDIEKLLNEQNLLIDELRAAQTDEARKKAEDALEQKKQELRNKQRALDELKKQGKPRGGGNRDKDDGDKPKPGGVKIKCDPNDPLCGI